MKRMEWGEEFKEASWLSRVSDKYEEIAEQLTTQESEKEQTGWEKTVSQREKKKSCHEAVSSVWICLFASPVAY